mmetsp:Transcript_1672/g.4704  ORF Transcript_1672/g.4704 Transcript_1672/m.4704 type:complete len:340 (-) Transcript_1672:389-1408(-)
MTAVSVAGHSSSTALALAALLRTPAPPAALRCVTNPTPPAHQSLFEDVRRLAMQRYLERTPACVKAVELLESRGGRVHNDHVALRSFNDGEGSSGLAQLERIFVHFGYQPQDSLEIPGLPLNARWYEPPETTPWPKVFISELRLDALPTSAACLIRDRVRGCLGVERSLAALGIGSAEAIADIMDLPVWRDRVTAADEAELRALAKARPDLSSAAEYAAWTLTHGGRWNHLTVLVNSLGPESPVHSLAEANAFLRAEGFTLNPAGGVDGFTQGSRGVSLEQSSTVADPVEETFACGTTKEVPCAFLELIERHDGFRGFLGQNARGIFDSTNSAAWQEPQ